MGRSARPTDDRRLVLFGGLLALAFVGIGVRLLMVQGLDAANYAQRGVDQRVREEILDAPRGTIYDRDSVELAVTINAETLVANPQDIENPRLAADLLAPYVNVEPDILADRLDGPGGFAYVARRLERSVASEIKDVIEEHDLNGFEFKDEAKRVYPSGALAAQVIGFVQVDENRGLGGIEYQFDEQLAGVPGRRIVERDPHGRVIPQGAFLIEPETPGADLVLTIDREIQFAADRALTAAVRRTNAVGGSIIVLDVQTGAILALANSPTFDPNQRAGVNPEALRNRAVTDTYEPGSTLKVVTVAAALDEGIVTARSLFEVPQEIEIHDKTYSDASKHEPQLSVAEIVAASSNVGTILIQGQLGNEAHQRYLSAFGLGQPTSTGLPRRGWRTVGVTREMVPDNVWPLNGDRIPRRGHATANGRGLRNDRERRRLGRTARRASRHRRRWRTHRRGAAHQTRDLGGDGTHDALSPARGHRSWNRMARSNRRLHGRRGRRAPRRSFCRRRRRTASTTASPASSAWRP